MLAIDVLSHVSFVLPLVSGNEIKMLERCIQLNRKCASICYSASQIMSMDGEHTKQICNVCADICDACAEGCEKHKQMNHCQQCCTSM